MIGKRGVVAAVALMVGGSVFCGCAPKKSGADASAGNQSAEAATAVTAENRVERLGAANDAFAAARKDLQGHSDEQGRRELADALGKLQDVLSLLKGDDVDGAFRQQIRIIERARTRLTGDTATAPEPTVNAAIRAAQNAVTTIATDRFAEDDSLKNSLQSLQTRVDALNTVRGPIHGFETARALDDIGGIAQRMTELMQQRMPQPEPATAPAAAQ